KVTGNPVKLSDTPGEPSVAPPLLGQHTQEVLEGLGYSAKEIEELKQAKLI
ncbi:MAG: frc, partial [Deltaproteobacteria bacterium]|nr:frc [Deltaproteobacteria bacterium]